MKKKIRFVAPSWLLGEVGQEKLSKTVEEFTKLGFEVTLSKHLNSNPKTRPINKAEDLVDAFNSDADIVWSVGGGLGMIKTMKCLDFSKIQSKDKLFIGFSDNTCLTYTLVTMFDIPTIIAQNGKGMRLVEKEDRKDVFRMINGEKDFHSYDYWENEENEANKPDIEFINYEKPVTGLLLGGCIEVLKELEDAGLDNTLNYVNRHKDEGIIFVFDNDGSNPSKLKKNLESFKENHWFDNVSMFICSRNYKYYEDKVKKKLNKVYLEVLGTLNKPIILNADIGHMDPLIPLYLGKKCTVSKEDKKILFHYE